MSQIEISVPETLLYQMEITARKEGVSVEEYILFALTRQTMLTSAIKRVPEENLVYQNKDFADQLKRLGTASSKEMEKILRERETVNAEPELEQKTVSHLKSLIAEAKVSS